MGCGAHHGEPVAPAGRSALLNLSGGFREFIRRGGVLPPPQISKSALTGVGRDPVIGQMLPQPEVTAGNGETRPLDVWFGCQQWRVLGVGVDPAIALSARDRAILDGLGATRVAINASAPSARPCSCNAATRPFSIGRIGIGSEPFSFAPTISSPSG
jgi:hypothetical protein